MNPEDRLEWDPEDVEFEDEPEPEPPPFPPEAPSK
jgi:hypothetical protein